VAQRLGWPDGASAACSELEHDFPRWSVWFSRGNRTPLDPGPPGYRAQATTLHGGKNHHFLMGDTPEALRQEIEAREATFLQEQTLE
jgi:hypothetical protein